MTLPTIPHTSIPVRNDISVEELRRLFAYNPETGDLIRTIKTWRRDRIGEPIRTKAGSKGYFSYMVSIKGKVYKLHRIIWTMQTGEWPLYEIDHINKNPFDNRWCNLRQATRAQNRQNIPKTKRNTSGVKGVRKSNAGSTWTAEIRANGQRYWKCFPTKEEAVEWRQEMSKRLHNIFSREE